MTIDSNTTAFVTGATAGFGAAIAKRFLSAGARVVVAGRRKDRLDALAAESGGRAHPLVLDLTDGDAIKAAFASLPSDFAAIDVLVNNAGLALGLESAEAVPLDDWDTMVATNVSGLIACTRAALPGMVERGCGHVISIGSVAATNPYAGATVYGATKAFVAQFMRSLKCDMLGKGVRTTNVAPGLSQTEFSAVRFKGDAAKADQIYAGVEPLSPEDIAEAVFWAANLPPHVNINEIEMMPACQAPAPTIIKRD